MAGKSMVEGTPWKHILKFAFPVLAGSLLQQLYSTVDTIIVGNFSGEAALSAVGTTGSFIFLFLAVAMGFSAGNGVVVAQSYGAGDQKQVKANASTGILELTLLYFRAVLAFCRYADSDVWDQRTGGCLLSRASEGACID